ncbi:MAG: chemotaxis protein CheC [Longimicrobiales bacterium]
MNVRELGALQLDGLREVSNVGAGHAATALSQLTGRRIMVEVPRIAIVPLEGIAELVGKPDTVMAGVVLQVLGDVTGRAIQLFPTRTATRIVEILLRRTGIEFPDGLAELERSALMEVGNILTGAYLNALSDFLGMLLLASVPALAIDLVGAILTSSHLNFREDADELVICVDTLFSMDEDEVALNGHFLLLPDPASLEVMLRALRLA